jgi:hypothetical protein
VSAALTETRPSAVFEIDSSSKPGDGGERRGGKKAAGAEDDEEPNPALEIAMEADGDSPEDSPAKQIDYFA